MSSTGAGYDISPTTFSPDGRLFQVEYATKAVESSGTAIGLRCKDGIILAVENVLLSKLLVAHSNRRTFPVGDHACIAVAGLVSDGRQIVNRAREEAENYKENYGGDIPPSVLADRLAQFVHFFTLNGSLRPFGASVLVAGHDHFAGTHELHMVEPSGVAYKYFGAAVGKGRQGAKTEIEKLKLTETTADEAVKEVAKILHKLHDEAKDKPFELEMAWITEKNGWKAQAVPRDVIDAAEKWAKEAIEAEDMDESDDEAAS